jgi:hypothetical protein
MAPQRGILARDPRAARAVQLINPVRARSPHQRLLAQQRPALGPLGTIGAVVGLERQLGLGLGLAG